MSKSVDDSGTQRHLLDDSVLDDVAVCTSSDSSLPGSGLLFIYYLSLIYSSIYVYVKVFNQY